MVYVAIRFSLHEASDAGHKKANKFFQEEKDGIEIEWDKKSDTFYVGKLTRSDDFFKDNHEEVKNEIGRLFLQSLENEGIDWKKHVKELYVSVVIESENLISEGEIKPEFKIYLKSKTND